MSTLPRHDVVHPDGRRFRFYGDVDAATLAAVATQPVDSATTRRHCTAGSTGSPERGCSCLRPGTCARARRPPATPLRPCPLCPGGPELPGPFGLAVFDNRFPSLRERPPALPLGERWPADLVAPSIGRCLVVVYTSDARRAPQRAHAPAVRRRRIGVAGPHHRSVGRRPRLRDGVREPRQRRRRDAAPPPRSGLRLRARSPADRVQAGRARPPPARPRRLPRMPARRRGLHQRAGHPCQRALRRRHPLRFPLAARGARASS